MCVVYRGSTLNIAATASENGQGGCFRDRIPAKEPKFQIGEYFYRIIKLNIWYDNVEARPLCGRGWVFQERILAPRTLHFGKHQIFWECRELHCCELVPDSFKTSLRPKDLYFLHQRNLQGSRNSLFDDPLTKGVTSDPYFWQIAICKYSTTSLTKESDKLPAIAGLAKLVKFHSGDQYLAGLWRKDIEKQLVWKSDVGYRPDIYRAPSWSWPSWEGSIFFDERVINLRMAVTDVTIVPSGVDEFAGVKFGSLSVRCEALQVPKFSWNYILSSVKFLKCVNAGDNFCHFDGGATLCEYSEKTIYLLKVGDIERGVACLMLEPVEEVKGQYRRIGAFEYKDYHNVKARCPEALEDLLYHFVDRTQGEGREKYFITLI